MKLPNLPGAKTLTLLGILLCFVLGSFGISLAHDPGASTASLQILQLSPALAVTHIQPEHYALGLAVVAEADGAQKPLSDTSARVEYCFVKPGGRTMSCDTASLRTPKVSLQITNSALQI
jgi:hypothetical protein